MSTLLDVQIGRRTTRVAIDEGTAASRSSTNPLKSPENHDGLIAKRVEPQWVNRDDPSMEGNPGTLYVPRTPTSDSDVVCKAYVDNFMAIPFSHILQPWVAGRWYGSSWGDQFGGVNGWVRGWGRMDVMHLGRNFTFDQVGFSVGSVSFGTGSSADIGIYRIDPTTLLPTQLLHQETGFGLPLSLGTTFTRDLTGGNKTWSGLLGLYLQVTGGTANGNMIAICQGGNRGENVFGYASPYQGMLVESAGAGGEPYAFIYRSAISGTLPPVSVFTHSDMSSGGSGVMLRRV